MTEEPDVDLPPVPAGLNQPWRALIAVVEVLAAAGAVWAAYWAWPRGIVTITDVADDGTRLQSTRFFGNWLAAAILLGTVAALLVLDAVRQAVLAFRARPRRRRKHAASS